jgi:hypothetical protein
VGTGSADFKEIRTALQVGKKRTVAIADVEVSGFSGRVIGVSGDAARRTIVGATVAPNTTRTGPGRLDAEAKILDHLESRIGRNSTGTINLSIDNVQGACLHCAAAILEFRRNYPGISLNVSVPKGQ